MTIIKDAKIQSLIGVEANAYTGETQHTIMIVIEAKNIDPADFAWMKSKKSMIIISDGSGNMEDTIEI